MKFLVVLTAAVACYAAPQVMPHNIMPGNPVIAHAESRSPSVMKISKPGIRFNVPQHVSYSAPGMAAAPAPLHMTAPVHMGAPAPIHMATPVQMSSPRQYAATPVQVAGVPSPVVVAAAPEPHQAPEPPMPSFGTNFVGKQFYAQDGAGQYTFGHWGGPHTRVETRDFLGRTSGSFAYVDPTGDVQVRKYAAAPASGFKVAASDLPEDTPAVAQVKAAHAKTHADAAKTAAVAA